jgi:predicted phosphodiesterase
MMAKNILVVGDSHEPFCKSGYLEFCQRIHKELKCDEVIHVGDLVDNHAISYHEHDPNGRSPIDEMEQTDKALQRWFKAFPSVKLCRGNHDHLVDRKGKTNGLPTRCFKDFRDIWNLPKSWKDDFHFIIDGVKYTHGTGYSGRMGHLNCAMDNRMSCVIGHLHSSAGIEYSANELDCIWGMNVGCGIDRKAYAFEYGRDIKQKPVLAAGVVEYTRYGTNPRLFRMELNKA